MLSKSKGSRRATGANVVACRDGRGMGCNVSMMGRASTVVFIAVTCLWPLCCRPVPTCELGVKATEVYQLKSEQEPGWPECWRFVKCRTGAVDYSYVGDVPGTICEWICDGETVHRVRSDRYTLNCEWHFAEESIMAGEKLVARGEVGSFGGVVYKAFEYIGPVKPDSFAAGSTSSIYQLEIVEGGELVSLYEASAEPFRVAIGSGVVGADAGAQLISGSPWPAVEAFCAAGVCVRRQGSARTP